MPRHVRPMHKQFIDPTKRNADVILPHVANAPAVDITHHQGDELVARYRAARRQPLGPFVSHGRPERKATSGLQRLLPVAQHPLSGPLLALASTFAGNLFIVGSIANIIVVDAARRSGVVIDWRQHARIGVPVTVATLAVTAHYLAWRMPG